MTASDQPQVRPVPRPLIRTFWAMHRAIYRLTGGRLGLQQPERGSKFGMLRLHTTGRRTGRSRTTMIGYFEDGSNLVSLAMNGWGKEDPAWWLNLQATPEATVDMPGGSRRVSARAATGAERDRLWVTFRDYPGWVTFRDYPGWGTDINALAANRAAETTVVVLETKGVQS